MDVSARSDELTLNVRWSEHEAMKPYARPFGVTVLFRKAPVTGMVALNGRELVYFHAFQEALLALGGVLLPTHLVGEGGACQQAWLDIVGSAIPVIHELVITPHSRFNHEEGRMFVFALSFPQHYQVIEVQHSQLLEYQELQCIIAHRTGMLLRNEDVEQAPTTEDTRLKWEEYCRGVLVPPDQDEAMAEKWPWGNAGGDFTAL
ncbi:MAG: hypothetical protein ACP5OR_08325 [Candidatus Dormibacteria bacterium]